MKMAAFGAGINPHICFFTNLGDFLAVGPQVTYTEGAPNFVFPDWKRAGASASSFLSAIIKAMLPGSTNKTYSAFQVHSILFDATAGSIRVGVVNFLLRYMPPEFAAYLTGHRLTGIGALFEYLRVQVRICRFGLHRVLSQV